MKKAFVAGVWSVLFLLELAVWPFERQTDLWSAAVADVADRSAGSQRPSVKRSDGGRPEVGQGRRTDRTAGGNENEPDRGERDKLRSRIEQLLKQLGSDSRAERRRAESELLQLGPETLPLLPTAEEVESLAVADALVRVRRKLEWQLVKRWVEPTCVSVQKGVSLEHGLEQLARQSGNFLDWRSLPLSVRQTPLSKSFERVTFWRCLNQLAADFRFGFQLREDSFLSLDSLPAEAEVRGVSLARRVWGASSRRSGGRGLLPLHFERTDAAASAVTARPSVHQRSASRVLLAGPSRVMSGKVLFDGEKEGNRQGGCERAESRKAALPVFEASARSSAGRPGAMFLSAVFQRLSSEVDSAVKEVPVTVEGASAVEHTAGIGGNILVLVPQDRGKSAPVAVAAGAFRISCVSGLPRRWGTTARWLLPVTFQVLPEPRLQVVMLKYRQGDFCLQNEDRTRFVPLSPEARSDLPLGDGRRTVVFVIDRKAVQKDQVAAPNQWRLRGKVVVQVAAAPHVFDFGRLNQCQWRKERMADVTVRVGRVETRRHGDVVRVWVDVILVYDRGGPAFDSHRTWVFHNPVWVMQPSGDIAWPEGEVRAERQADGAIQLRYSFRLPADQFEQARLLCRVPVAVVDTPLEFDVPELRLPSLATAVRSTD